MSHHSSTPPEPSKELREAMKDAMGEYPDGRLNKDDAGAIAVAIGVENDRVVIQFTKPVAWIGFTGDQAMTIASALIKHARAVGVTAPLILRVGE